MATIPSQSTAAVGQRFTADMWNDDVRDAVDFLLDVPRCAAYGGTATTLTTTATWYVIALDSEVFDTPDAMHSTSTNNSRVYAQTAGTYDVKYMTSFVANATGYRQVDVEKNAAGTAGGGTALGHNRLFTTHASVTARVGGSFLCSLAAGDYIEMFGYQTSGGSLATVTGLDATFLHMNWIGT